VLTLGSVKCKIACLSIIIVISALPFLNQPVHIDDTLFLQVAHNIINNPLDPYGSSINWLGDSEKLFKFFSNPPLFSYYLACVITAWGESERAMHLACIPFTLMAGIGMFFLSRRFGSPAFASVLFLVLSPAFFTMSHTLMPDVAMSAFVICAVLLFIRGYDGDRPLCVIAGGLLAGVAPLFRYNGLIASVIIMLYIVLNFRKEKIKYGAVLLIPALLFAGWNLFTMEKYGSMHFLNHFHFQNDTTGGFANLMLRSLSNIIYISSCFVFLFLLLLWKKKNVSVVFLSFIMATVLTFTVQSLAHYAPVNLFLVFVIALGASSFFIITVGELIADAKSSFPRDSVFLVLWLVSILWMHKSGSHSAAKYMLVALPPVIIIALRGTGKLLDRKQIAAAVAFTFLFGVITATADFRLAGAYKQMANDALEQTARFNCPKIFTGHWGFQYYMEKKSALAYPQMTAVSVPAVFACVRVSYPQRIHPETEAKMKMILQKNYYDDFPFRTLSIVPGYQANFYTHFYSITGKGPAHVIYGMLPFSFSRAPLETLTIYELK
jgi:4-amino-4-deoxy-L-arabinose transferase-like glycosyltransferase